MCVRSPAAFPFCSRSNPSMPPRIAAISKRNVIRVTPAASGRSENSCRTVFPTSCHHIPIIAPYFPHM